MSLQHIAEGGQVKTLCGQMDVDLYTEITDFGKPRRQTKYKRWCKICKMLYNANFATNSKSILK